MTTNQTALFADTSCGATLSECRLYRYQLWRVWDDSKPYLNIIGLNPSTADERTDDPTIRRCVDFAKQWNFGALYMTNLFAWRDKSPAAMKKALEPIGQDNNGWLIETAAYAGLVMAAWGIHGTFKERDKAVIAMLPKLYCFGTNDDGTPKHPLFLPKDTKAILFKE
jgi:hypothetical protein